MESILDVGEYLPYAKKHHGHIADPDSLNSNCNNNRLSPVTLKYLWPEPDWVELFNIGYPKDLLARIYSYYHGLRLKPKVGVHLREDGVDITDLMWEDAFIKSILFIRDWCESASSLASFDVFNKAFKKHLNINDGSKNSYQLYAAGRNTGRTMFHALSPKGKYKEYETLLPYLDWPNSVNAKNIKLFPIKLINKHSKKAFYRLCDVNFKSVSWREVDENITNKFDTYESAVTALVKNHGSQFVSTPKAPLNLYTPKKVINNLMGAPTKFNSVSAEMLLRDFAFRGIQFGNALSNIERQTFISNTYHALVVLSEILEIPQRWIGAGALGLAFGARGSGSAAAHYEPSLNIINLTRFNGAGSIAHEFFHSIDNRLAKKCGHNETLYSELTKKPDHIDITHRLDAFNKITSHCIDKNSQYYNRALSIDGQKGTKKYWSLPSELIARAFEAYIQDRTEGMNISNQWLSFGTKESDHRYDMHPYPIGDERIFLNSLFNSELQQLFAAI
ncbi:LPD1 domain-containing protein [Pseudoalteromonas sp. S554]|uniref:LPD1 domain-containing protein n=1 Tax=Pseudoalteromonas sp. S554 TaxID=2066516 RepID=UPI00110CD81E|nr:LPD1 domain-containing protein [Pseudoalteromonas sp. S554]TMS80565.1 hypothetical protein CWB65_14705 [Pseudoalteromonas sp. S554]